MIQKIKKLRNYANAERASVAKGQHKSGTYSRSAGDNAQIALAKIEKELEAMYEVLCEAQASPAVIIKM